MRTLRCGACTVAAAALGLLAACSSAVVQLPPPLASGATEVAVADTLAASPTATKPAPAVTIMSVKTRTPQPTAVVDALLGPLTYPANINPLSGMLVSDPAVLQRKPLAIKISNFPRYVRPQAGLAAADMVWEHYSEGGTSRYTAIFLGAAAERIGPVRSARLIDTTLVDMVNSALVASGTSKGTMRRLAPKPWFPAVITNLTGFDCPPLCMESIDANSVYTSTAALWQVLTEKNLNAAAQVHGFAFQRQIPAGGQPALTVGVDFSSEALTEWRYNAASGNYRRWIDASPTELVEHVDAVTNQQLTADTLVLIFANHVVDFTVPEDYDADGLHSTYATEVQLWGAAPRPLLVFRDGQAFSGQWQRADTGALPLLTDSSGAPLALRPGKIWIQVLGLESDRTSTGAKWYVRHHSPKDYGELGPSPTPSITPEGFVASSTPEPTGTATATAAP